MFTGFGVPTEATAPVRVALAVHPPIETSQLLVTLNLAEPSVFLALVMGGGLETVRRGGAQCTVNWGLSSG
jgi:hypothetical protein